MSEHTKLVEVLVLHYDEICRVGTPVIGEEVTTAGQLPLPPISAAPRLHSQESIDPKPAITALSKLKAKASAEESSSASLPLPPLGGRSQSQETITANKSSNSQSLIKIHTKASSTTEVWNRTSPTLTQIPAASTVPAAAASADTITGSAVATSSRQPSADNLSRTSNPELAKKESSLSLEKDLRDILSKINFSSKSLTSMADEEQLGYITVAGGGDSRRSSATQSAVGVPPSALEASSQALPAVTVQPAAGHTTLNPSGISESQLPANHGFQIRLSRSFSDNSLPAVAATKCISSVAGGSSDNLPHPIDLKAMVSTSIAGRDDSISRQQAISAPGKVIKATVLDNAASTVLELPAGTVRTVSTPSSTAESSPGLSRKGPRYSLIRKITSFDGSASGVASDSGSMASSNHGSNNNPTVQATRRAARLSYLLGEESLI